MMKAGMHAALTFFGNPLLLLSRVSGPAPVGDVCSLAARDTSGHADFARRMGLVGVAGSSILFVSELDKWLIRRSTVI